MEPGNALEELPQSSCFRVGLGAGNMPRVHVRYRVSEVILFNDPVRREWLSRPRSMTRDQFVDACMLAGTEYCLTFPYLQAEPSPHANFKSRFPPVMDLST